VSLITALVTTGERHIFRRSDLPRVELEARSNGIEVKKFVAMLMEPAVATLDSSRDER